MIRLKNAVIKALALCKRGKNRLRTVYKSAADGAGAGQLELQALVKSAGDPERGELLAVVYAPERPDDDGDGMSATEIRKAAHRAMRDGLELDIEHDGQPLTKEEAWIAESFIVAPGDERFLEWEDYQGNPVGDLTGAWASLIRLESEELRAAYRNGDFDGISLFGEAAVEQRKSQSAAEQVVRRLEDANTEIPMNPEELTALLKAQSEELLAKVDEKLAARPALTPATPATPATPPAGENTDDKEAPRQPAPRPVFEGDANDPEALTAYSNQLKAWELNEKIASGEITAEELTALAKSAAEGEPSDDEAGVAKEDTPEVKALKRKLFKAQCRSNVKQVEKSGDGEGELTEQAAVEFGLSIAKLANGESPSSFKTVAKTD